MNVNTFYGKKKSCTASSLNRLLDEISEQEFDFANVYITPPVDESDGDSDTSDKEISEDFSTKFCPKILTAPAEATLVVRKKPEESKSGEESEEEVSNNTDKSRAKEDTTSKGIKRVYTYNDENGKNNTPKDETIISQRAKRHARCRSSSKEEKIEESYKEGEVRKSSLQKGKDKWKIGDISTEIALTETEKLENIEVSNPVDLFELFWDNDFLKYVRQQTILYSKQKNANCQFEVTVDEIKVFFATLMISGYSPKPRRDMHWSLDADLHNGAIADAMPRNRFREILKYLHFSDNNVTSQDDKFGKVRPLIQQLNKQFIKYMPILTNVDVDESMIPYYSHHSCKQRIQGKPIRYGFKFWSMNASNGYLISTEPYQGKGSMLNNVELGLGASVVLTFAERLKNTYPDRRFNFFMDNFFTGLPLLRRMTEMGFGCTGTVRQNRLENCPLHKDNMKKKARGSIESYVNADKAIVMQWKDNATVQLASNSYGVAPTKSARRYSAAEKKYITVQMPNAIKLYNS